MLVTTGGPLPPESTLLFVKPSPVAKTKGEISPSRLSLNQKACVIHVGVKLFGKIFCDGTTCLPVPVPSCPEMNPKLKSVKYANPRLEVARSNSCFPYVIVKFWRKIIVM